ncbi:hypothetical protein, partial [Nitrococcus mobilis]|uniref:hypothetical protein n=1 Tax=Nitrococcus mobilis TaxID=35797 RepID=UPI001E4FEB69
HRTELAMSAENARLGTKAGRGHPQVEAGLMPNLALPSSNSVPARSAAELAIEPPMRRGIEPRRMGTAHRHLR